MDENSDEVSEPEQGNSKSVEFSTSDANHDYAKGLYLQQARHLQEKFVELYKEDPTATFRLTLERL